MKITKEKNYEFIIAFMAILALIWLVGQWDLLIWAVLIIGIIGLAWSKLLIIPAKGYFGFLKILGSINSRILLSIVFFVILTPIAYLKSIFSKEDALILKNSSLKKSFWKEINKKFKTEDITNPY